MSSDRALIELEKQNQSLDKQNQSLRQRVKKMSGDSADAVKQSILTATAAGAAFGGAYIEARYPDKAQIASVPLTAVAGGALAIAGAMEVGGKESSDVIGMAGVGLICAYSAKVGTQKGTDARNAPPK